MRAGRAGEGQPFTLGPVSRFPELGWWADNRWVVTNSTSSVYRERVSRSVR